MQDLHARGYETLFIGVGHFPDRHCDHLSDRGHCDRAPIVCIDVGHPGSPQAVTFACGPHFGRLLDHVAGFYAAARPERSDGAERAA